MRHLIAGWLTATVLLAGCGEVADTPAGSARTDREEPVEEPMLGEDAEEVGSSGGLIFAFTGKHRDARDVYAVFARLPNPRDAGAVTHATHWYDEPYDRRDSTGRVLASEARVLLDGLGGDEDILYAAPTDKGNLCVGLAPYGGSHCTSPGPDGLTLAWSYDPKDSLVVYGMVGNDVIGVDVRVSARTHPARIGENGFAARIRNVERDALNSVVLHFRDRQSETVELP